MGASKKFFLIFLPVTLTALAFNNCSRVEFSQVTEDAPSLVGTSAEPEAPPVDNEPPVPLVPPVVEEVVKTCADLIASGDLQTTSFQKIKFADTGFDRRQVCDYNKNGNLAERNDFVQTRYEQSQKVDLPTGAVICTVELKTDAREFIYDDMFYLTFNDYVLATSLKTSLVSNPKMIPEVIEFGEAKLPIKLFKYDWLNIGGSPFNNNSITSNPTAFNYCLGSEFGVGECRWPLTQQQGDISFGWDPELLINIGLKADSQNQRFGFIVTGDNDESTDCYHPDMEFEVKTGYYIP